MSGAPDLADLRKIVCTKDIGIIIDGLKASDKYFRLDQFNDEVGNKWVVYLVS